MDEYDMVVAVPPALAEERDHHFYEPFPSVEHCEKIRDA
jgi:hypothetical protein